jgi:beta-galactosidase
MVYYIGCGLEEALSKKIFETIIAANNIATVDTDDGVEAVVRGDDARKVRMLINHNAYEANAGDVVLAPFECKIVEI